MSDFTPVEVVLDYADDKVVVDGTELPVALSSIGATAVTERGRSVVTLTLEVDQVRSIAAAPDLVDIEVPAPLTAEEFFEQRLSQAKERNARR